MDGHLAGTLASLAAIVAAEADAVLMDGHREANGRRDLARAAEADAVLMDGHVNTKDLVSSPDGPQKPTRS